MLGSPVPLEPMAKPAVELRRQIGITLTAEESLMQFCLSKVAALPSFAMWHDMKTNIAPEED